MSKEIVVRAGKHTRVNCPVEVFVPDKIEKATVVEKETGLPLRSQVFAEADGARVSFIVDRLDAGTERTYALSTESCAPGHGVELEDDGKEKVAIRIAGKTITNYYYGPSVVRPFLYPFIGPYNASVTRHFPMRKDVAGESTDHKHHKSIWVAWGDVNGTDDWSEEEGHGYVVHKSFEVLESGPARARIVVKNEWLTAERKKLMEEIRTIVLWNVYGNERLLDMSSTFIATEGDVRFGDTKEGGIASVRVATSMDGNKSGLITLSSGALGEAESWGKRAHWCDYSGPVDDKIVGITIFDHVDNLRHPTYWHVRDYGLMTANPFGLSHFRNNKNLDGSHVLKASEKLVFKYRIYTHAGGACEAPIGDNYQNFINPPAVELA